MEKVNWWKSMDGLEVGKCMLEVGERLVLIMGWKQSLDCIIVIRFLVFI
jgi:hypothetical protein